MEDKPLVGPTTMMAIRPDLSRVKGSTPPERLAWLIKSELNAKGVTPTAFAKRANIDHGNLWRLLNSNKGHRTSIDFAYKILRALGISMAVLDEIWAE